MKKKNGDNMHAQVCTEILYEPPIGKTGKKNASCKAHNSMWSESQVPVSWVNTILHHASKFSLSCSCVVPLHKDG